MLVCVLASVVVCVSEWVRAGGRAGVHVCLFCIYFRGWEVKAPQYVILCISCQIGQWKLCQTRDAWIKFVSRCWHNMTDILKVMLIFFCHRKDKDILRVMFPIFHQHEPNVDEGLNLWQREAIGTTRGHLAGIVSSPIGGEEGGRARRRLYRVHII